jgi:hypothetical protein
LLAFKGHSGPGAGISRGRFFTLAAFSLLSCYLLVYVYLYGVNFPVADDWETVALVGKLNNGTIRLRDLFAFHFEHRIFFPKLVMLLNGSLFSLNLKLQMFLSALLWILLCRLLVVRFLDLTAGRSEYLAIIVPFILLNVRQFQNFLWGFQITFLMAIVLPVICFYLLRGEAGRQTNSRRFFLAMLLGIVASFSCLHGLFVWPAALLLLSGQRRTLICWGVVGIIVWCSYFYGYQSPANHPSTSLFLTRPLASLRFLACLVGNLVVGSDHYAFMLGAIFLGMFSSLIFVVREERTADEHNFWRATALFSLFALLSITVGRIGLGPGAAFSSRYVTFSALFLVAVLALSISAVVVRKWLRPVIVAAITALILVLPFSYEDGIINGKSRQVDTQKRYLLLPHYRTVGCGAIGSDCWIDTERVSILESIGHSAFKQLKD